MSEMKYEPLKEIVKSEVIKGLVELGERKGYISISKDSNRITYIASGKSRSFTNPEEKIRAMAYIELIEKYKYNPKRINQEISPPRREPKLPSDLVVYEKERDKVFIVVETKAEETDKKIEEAKREGLGNANLHNARYLWIVCGTEKFAYDIYEKPPLDELEKYRISNIPVAYGKEPKFMYKKGDQEWDLNPISFNELGRKFQLCHDEIWEGGKRDPAVAFDEMSKLMFIKIWDERFTEDGKYYRFQIGSQEEKRSVAIRIKDIYKDAQEKEPDVFKGEIELPDRIIHRLVEILQDFSFTKTDLDAKGRAFEKFLGMVFRGQFGQYFTRREIVEFMVGMLEPTKDDTIIDPACGSGGFLLYTMDRVRKRAKEVYKSSPRTIDEIYWNFPRDSVFGIDNNDRIARVAMMDMVIHDDGHTNIENNNALFEYSRFSPKRDIKPGKYTLLMTNPPFGAKESNPDILKLHELGSKIKKRKSQRSEILFIERCLDLLRPGGRMGIVLPDGILTNSTLQYVRDFIERRARILAVISLPQSAFVPAGAGVKASLLFLRKKNYDSEDIGNYPIFMAIAEHIGYDATERPDKNDLFKKERKIVNGKEVEGLIIPGTGILGEYKEFLEGKTEFNPGFILMNKDLERRFDPYYYKPEFLNEMSIIQKFPSVKKLRDIVEPIKNGSTPHKGKFEKGGIAFIRSQDLVLDEIHHDNLLFITQKFNEILKRSEVHSDDVLVAVVGATLGQVAIVPPTISVANINQNVAKLRVKNKSEVFPYFLYAFLSSNFGQKQMFRQASLTTQAYLNNKQLGDILVPLPPLKIQDKIANVMEGAFRVKKEKLANAKELIDSIEPYVLEELGIKLPEIKEKRSFALNLNELKGRRFDSFFYKPKHRIIENEIKQGKYDTVRLGEIITYIRYGASVKNIYAKDGIPLLRILNLKPNEVYLSDIVRLPYEKKKELGNAYVKKGDFLISRSGTIGVTAIVPEEADGYAYGSFMIKFQIKTDIIVPFYLSVLMNLPITQEQIQRSKIGAVQGNITIPTIKDNLVPLPPLPIQEIIAKEVQSRREKAKKLKEEAEKIVEQAKDKVERMILGKPCLSASKESVERSKSRDIGTLPFLTSEKLKVRKPAIRIKYKFYQMLDGSTKELVQQVGDGSIIKRFDKTPIPGKKTDVVCPHFLELKWATGCPYDCSWCYLKGTFRFLPYKAKPHIKDFNKIRAHVETFLDWVKEPEVLNSGELADSLMFEGNKKSFINFIVPFFEQQNKHKILLLTKSDRIQNLLRLNFHKQVVASFSLNAIPVAKEWELKAPSIEKRIVAAKALYDKGYEVRIRIDPMVPVNDWEKLYIELIDILFNSFIPERITLGSLRGLQSTINGTEDKSWVKYLSEYSNWGKKININLRLAMYERLISYLKEEYNFSKISLCKETVAVWEILKLDYKKIKCNCVW